VKRAAFRRPLTRVSNSAGRTQQGENRQIFRETVRARNSALLA
jgi:hypothetical protein